MCKASELSQLLYLLVLLLLSFDGHIYTILDLSCESFLESHLGLNFLLSSGALAFSAALILLLTLLDIVSDHDISKVAHVNGHVRD